MLIASNACNCNYWSRIHVIQVIYFFQNQFKYYSLNVNDILCRIFWFNSFSWNVSKIFCCFWWLSVVLVMSHIRLQAYINIEYSHEVENRILDIQDCSEVSGTLGKCQLFFRARKHTFRESYANNIKTPIA